jgi:hypothetical protein
VKDYISEARQKAAVAMIPLMLIGLAQDDMEFLRESNRQKQQENLLRTLFFKVWWSAIMADLPEFDLDVRKLKLSEIHLADYNPRKKVHDMPDFYEFLYKSLLRFGYINPIVVNIHENKNIIVVKSTVSIICEWLKTWKEQGRCRSFRYSR